MMNVTSLLWIQIDNGRDDMDMDRISQHRHRHRIRSAIYQETSSERHGLSPSSKRPVSSESRRLEGLGTTLDILLLSISIMLVVILIVMVTWFCFKKRKDRRNDEKLAKRKQHPEITIVRSRMTGSDDSSKTNDDALSDVSSIWDSGKE